ncbi:MAG: potassium channel family protein [Planctomycetota bacterium]|jgi:hypothetical protein
MPKRIEYNKFYWLHIISSIAAATLIYSKPAIWSLLLGLSVMMGFFLFFIIFVFWRPVYYGYYGFVKLPELLLWQFYYVALIILAFAHFYQIKGIINTDGNMVKEYIPSIYFSVVTFTTLGYGDFKPAEQIRMVAALEAFLGYICMGVFIATLVAVLHKIDYNKNDNNGKNRLIEGKQNPKDKPVD